MTTATIFDYRFSHPIKHRFELGENGDFETPTEFMRWAESIYGVSTKITDRFYQLTPSIFCELL